MSQEQSQLSSYDKDAQSVEEIEYGCPHCDFADEREWLVRAHINLSEAEPHHTHDGFFPEDELLVRNADGETINRVGGNPTRRFETLQGLTVNDMPDTLSEPQRHIVVTAVQNLNETYSRIHELANDRLREAGFNPVDYNTAYRTTIETLGVARKSKDTRSGNGRKGYDDLTDKQRAVINEHIRDPDQNPSELADNAGVDPSYPYQVIEKYGYIAEGMTNADVIPVGSDEDSSSDDFESDSTDFESGFESSSEDAQYLTVSQVTQNERETPKQSYDDLTLLQQDVLDAIVENPDKSHSEIAEMVGCDQTYPGKVEEEFSALLTQRRGESTDAEPTTLTIGDQTMQATQDLAEEYEDRTDKQKAVIAELVKEDDPTDPDRDNTEIGRAAGVHGTYVTEVIKKYGDLATQLKGEGVADSTVPPEDEDDLAAEDETETATEDTEDGEQEFSEKFREAVESGDVTDVNVTAIQESLSEVDDVELIRQANVDDDRKTSTTEYERRIDALTDDEGSEAEAEDGEQEFSEQFREAVEAGDVTNVNVTAIQDNISEIDDAELIQQAQEDDDRKTSATEYERRLKQLGVEDEADAETEAESESETEAESESLPEETEPSTETPETAEGGPVETAQEAEIEGTPQEIGEGVPIEELEAMREQVDMLIRTADSEIESSDQKAPAARAKSVAEEFQRMLDERIETHSSSATEAAPTAD